MKLPFKQMGNVLPTLWNDRVTIYGTSTTNDGVFTDTNDQIIVKDEPAKIVLKGLRASEQSFFGTDAYDAKLLLKPGINIPAGAIVDVLDVNGNIVRYKRASKGYTGYISHQEVALVRDEKAKG